MKTILFLVYIKLYNCTSESQKHFCRQGHCMDGFLLHHFKWFVVVVYCYVFIYVCVKLL